MEYIVAFIIVVFFILVVIAIIVSSCIGCMEKLRRYNIKCVDGIYVNAVYSFNNSVEGKFKSAYHNVMVKSCKNGIVRYKMFGSTVIDSDTVEVFRMLYVLTEDF